MVTDPIDRSSAARLAAVLQDVAPPHELVVMEPPDGGDLVLSDPADEVLRSRGVSADQISSWLAGAEGDGWRSRAIDVDWLVPGWRAVLLTDPEVAAHVKADRAEAIEFCRCMNAVRAANHDLRGGLNNVVLTLELVRRAVAADEATNEILKRLEKLDDQVRRLTGMIDSASPEIPGEDEPAKFDMGALVHCAGRLHAPPAASTAARTRLSTVASARARRRRVAAAVRDLMDQLQALDPKESLALGVDVDGDRVCLDIDGPAATDREVDLGLARRWLRAESGTVDMSSKDGRRRVRVSLPRAAD